MKAWVKVKLREVVQEERVPVGTFDGNGLPVLGVTNVEGVTQTGVAASDDKSKYFLLRPGRFVYNPYRINVGSLGLSSASQNGICSPAYVVFSPTERINTQFLLHFLKSSEGNRLINFYGNRGTVRGALRFKDLCEIEIPLPSLEEQRRVVGRIEELSARVQEARGLRQQAVEEADALVGSTWTKLLTQSSGTEEIFDSIVTQRRGTAGLPLKDYQQSGKFPIIDQGQSYIGGYSDAEERVIKVDQPVVVWGDHTTNVKLVEFDFIPGADGTKVFLPQERVSAAFLFRILKGIVYPDMGYSRHYRFLKKLLVKIPPLPEQRWIVAELDALQERVDALKKLQAETSAELDALLPAILDRAFKGEL